MVVMFSLIYALAVALTSVSLSLTAMVWFIVIDGLLWAAMAMFLAAMFGRRAEDALDVHA